MRPRRRSGAFLTPAGRACAFVLAALLVQGSEAAAAHTHRLLPNTPTFDTGADDAQAFCPVCALAHSANQAPSAAPLLAATPQATPALDTQPVVVTGVRARASTRAPPFSH